MLRVSRRRYWLMILKWVSIATLGAIIFMPKVDRFSLPQLDLPLVGSAIATEAH